MFIQIFGSLKDDMETCKSYEQNVGSFKGCKHLNLIGEEDPSELMYENCVYADDCSCVVEADEQSP